MHGTTLMLTGGIIAVGGFTLVWLIDGASRPGYRPSYHPISALSLGPRGWVQVTSSLVTGALLVIFAIGAHAAGAGLTVSILLGVAGLGLTGAGVFPMDPMRGYPPGAIDGDPPEQSVRHRLHDLASIAVFLAVPAAATVSGITGAGAWRWYSLVSAAAGLLLLGWFITAYGKDTTRAGLIQRVMVTSNWTWVALLGLRLL
ncbi:MAG: DUF998 domain-containing protein [Nitriliruptoraceae bacterium]